MEQQRGSVVHGPDRDAPDRIPRFCTAIAVAGGDAVRTEPAVAVEATGPSWAKAASVAGRLRRNGRLAGLPHARPILSGKACYDRARPDHIPSRLAHVVGIGYPRTMSKELPPVDASAPSVAAVRAAAFRATREAHATELVEDYVELIADLIAEFGEARVSEVAEYMGVAQPTAAKMVLRLRSLDLVDGRPYRSLFLTDAGRALAERSRRRHDIVVAFLVKQGVPQAVADIDAEGMEHHVSDTTLAVLQASLEGKA